MTELSAATIRTFEARYHVSIGVILEAILNDSDTLIALDDLMGYDGNDPDNDPV